MTELLELHQLSAGYGEARVLSGVSFTLSDGQSLALLGRNGTGKTTLINTLIGLTTHQGGTIHLNGRDITRLPAEQRAHSGIGWVPQERNIFRSLTVEERALVLNPRLVLLDEPTEGLAPIIVDEVLRALRSIAREEGLSMIIVEQKAQKILSFTDHAIILDRGQIVHQSDSASLRKDTHSLDLHLGAVGKNPAS